MCWRGGLVDCVICQADNSRIKTGERICRTCGAELDAAEIAALRRHAPVVVEKFHLIVQLVSLPATPPSRQEPSPSAPR